MIFLGRLSVVAAVISAVAAQCTNPVVRREWNQLTTAEKNQYVAAVKASAKTITGTVAPGKMSLYDFVADHTQVGGVTHGNAQFYPFHRAMLYLWETTLAANGWTGGLVYWDWSAVSQNWWNADIFNYFGKTSRPEDNCLMDGEFSIGKYNVSPNPAFGSFARLYTGGDRNCLRRCGSKNALDNPESIASVHLVGTSYSGFRQNDAAGYHANGHITIGGSCDMGNFFSSPNDPIFFMHHAFVDKTWWKWQMLCPEYINDYEGAMVVSPATPSGVASLQQVLDGWGGYTVKQMLDTQNGDPLCYTYSQSAGDVTNFNPPRCPSGNPANKDWPFGQALHGESGGGGNLSSLTSVSMSFSSRTDGSSSSRTRGSSSITRSSRPTASGVVSVPTAEPTRERNLEAESAWFSVMVQELVVVHGANGTKRFDTSGFAGAGLPPPQISSDTTMAEMSTESMTSVAVTLGPTFQNSQINSGSISPQISVTRRDASSDSNSVLFNNLSDDGWQDKVMYNASEKTVCYDNNNDCVKIPDEFSVLAIYKDFVSIKSDSWALGSQIDPNNPMPVRMLYPPSKLSCEPYQTANNCTDLENCLQYPIMPDDDQLQARMMNKNVHQCYMNKVWQWIDECNSDNNCTSVATMSLKYYLQHQTWKILENVTSSMSSTSSAVISRYSISLGVSLFSFIFGVVGLPLN